MGIYKRNKRFPLVKIKRVDFEQNNKAFLKWDIQKGGSAGIIIKASLYFVIAVLLILSFSFISHAGKNVFSEREIAYADGQPEDASGLDIVFEGSLIDPKIILAQEMPVIYGVDINKAGSRDIDDSDIYFDVLPEDIKLEILRFINEPRDFFVGAQGPQILIYHTHTLEAYRQIDGQEYVEAGKWRTKDDRKSVIAVGNTLRKELAKYGYDVLHDTTNHEPPSLKTAYSRSRETLNSYKEKYPAINVYIDVHRDASTNEKDFVTITGEQCARVMFVVGPGKNQGEKPKFESNYKLALAITNELEDIKKGFTRPIRVQNSSKHYNQQMSDMCLLIEVGHNSNTLEQALNTAKYVALAISRVIEISGP